MLDTKEGVIRGFVSINLPDTMKRKLSDISHEFKGYIKDPRTRISWVRPESIHLTLKFLGSIESTLVRPIVQELEKDIRDYYSFKITLDDIGVFPNQNQPRIIWVGVSGGAEEVSSLQGRIERALSTLGFEVEKREFSPHLTLGRVKSIGSRGEVIRGLRAFHGIRIGEICVERVSLMKSTLTPKGAIYTELGSVTLKND